jgi:hypothetical protein
MNAAAPQIRIAVGIIVERRKARSAWAEFVWRPVAVLAGLPEAPPWTMLTSTAEVATFYAGAAEIELFRAETGNYRSNLASGAPLVWVALQETGADPSHEIVAATADPAEGEALTEPGQAIVEALRMPEPVRAAVAAFVAEHHIERPFQKRRRDRADPEALARRAPGLRHDDAL